MFKFSRFSLVLLCVVLAGALAPRPALASPETPTAIIYVPADMNLQSAISAIPDGGVIEIAGGTYASPDGSGWDIANMNKGFTIRAASGQSVVLDGQGNKRVVTFKNSSTSSGGPVVFEGITFRNGYTSTDYYGAAVTVYEAEATFIDCNFENANGNQPTQGGGGAYVGNNSVAFFFDSVFSNSTAKNLGAGMQVAFGAIAYIHNSYFLNNRINLAGHYEQAAGGAIHVVDAALRVSNSRFEDNEAGYVGGAIYVLGRWSAPYSTPISDAIISNSTFVDNHAIRHASVTWPYPTEGGAIHFEDQTLARVYNSRFFENSAENGGGVNTYRANVTVTDSVFLGNQATGTDQFRGFGGAIAHIANDTSSNPANYPSGSLTVTRTYIRGRYGSTTTAGLLAGGIYISGDTNRMYGQNGVSQNGTPAQNRSIGIFDEVLIYDTDVPETAVLGSGVGGGLYTDLADVTMTNSMIINADAIAITSGSGYASGGAMAILNNSVANISNITLARNSSGRWGAAVFGQGSTLNLSNCRMIENEMSPGFVEPISNSYGSAIYTSPDQDRFIPMLGSVTNCLISNNNGMSIFETDLDSSNLYNDLRYNGNTVYSTWWYTNDSKQIVYSNTTPPGYWSRAILDSTSNGTGLNNLIISRNNAPDTDKSQTNNTAPGSAPVYGDVIAVPRYVLPTKAYGDPAGNLPVYVGYAWSGGSATLNGNSVSGFSGVTSTTAGGSFTLNVNGSPQETVNVSVGATPSATFNATGSNPIQLQWSVTAGAFLKAAIDQEAGKELGASGSVNAPSSEDREFHLYVITQEGGVTKPLNTGVPLLSVPTSITVLAGKNIANNRLYVPITNAGGSILNWVARTNTPSLFSVVTSTGSTEDTDIAIFNIIVTSLNPGTHNGQVVIDAGAAGIETINVTVILVQNLERAFLPVIIKN